MSKSIVAVLFSLAVVSASFGQSGKPLLLRKPTVSRTEVAFSYAGDIWIASRDGGEARRLTTGVGIETDPLFSPDGTQIAFTGEYDGNQDVYVVPVSGGVPRRLTYHPGPDQVVGWTPDGKQVLFRSMRKAHADGVVQLFTIPTTGVFPAEVPLPRAAEGSFSPDAADLDCEPRRLEHRSYDSPRQLERL
jgi:tricorn protease